MRKLITTNSDFEKIAGYSRAVVQDNMCFVSGTTGYDYHNMDMPEDIIEQTRNSLKTIDHTLLEAGFIRGDIIKANYIITDAGYADIVFPILGQYFKGILPAATMIVAQLIRPEMKIEIDVTALRSNR